MPKPKFIVLSLALAVLVLAGSAQAPARAGDEFQDVVRAAHGHYRMAWFYTRTGNPDVATLELGTFRQRWGEIVARFGPAPPAPYAADKSWRKSLNEVTAVLDSAVAQADGGKLKQAHRTLVGVGKALAAIRKRNNVTVFLDLVETYGRHVEAVSPHRRKPVKLTPELLVFFTKMAKAMRTDIERIKADAPARYRNDAGFNASIKGNFDSLAKLDRGIKRKSGLAIMGSIRSVRSDYVLFYIRYG